MNCIKCTTQPINVNYQLDFLEGFNMLPDNYEFKTTFWSDFTIADKFGLSAIEDTYNRAFNEWKYNIVYITELSLVLNWKIWSWYNVDDDKAKLYDELWRKVDDWCGDNLEGEDADYYFEMTD